MKKIFTIAAIITASIAFAQDDTSTTNFKAGNVLSANLTASSPGQIGLSYEREGSSFFFKSQKKKSTVLNVSYGAMNYEVNNFDVDGTGFVIEYGTRNYYGKQGKEFKGFYTANYLSYGSIDFNETILGTEFDGTYSYFSFFSPEIGYKFKFGNFVVDPFIGAQWKIEIAGKGDIDNKNTDEWAFRGGIKLGYNF
ncbi:hypothetical protein [Flavobacterium litorale]|uniref:DUF3575 domain-containing protein n=1 Tax=Flavobacterium litorale TaxID=2856519 RepID=A0ABX8V4X5_9FLAO|nr:hypothetical protein [Flavobacterium litorale]QYJ67894.1 hypothetical protein K1I41_10135 [Flavobacterium litorale]